MDGNEKSTFHSFSLHQQEYFFKGDLNVAFEKDLT
jgi:hypothetical protein